MKTNSDWLDGGAECAVVRLLGSDGMGDGGRRLRANKRRRGLCDLHLLPQDAAEEVFAERGARQIYTQPGGGYEITTEILDAAPAARSSGSCRASTRLRCMSIRAAGRERPVWQFAWYAASDEGGRMYRCKVISDGAHCYALTFSVPEGPVLPMIPC